MVALLSTFLEWYENADLGVLRAATESLDDKQLALAYFGGGLWVLLAVTFSAAIAANVGFGQVPAWSTVAAVTGGIDILAAVGILADLHSGRGSWTDHAAPGLWLTLVGFAVAGVGGLFGARRPRPRMW